MRNMATEKRMPISLLVERIISVMTVLGLTCLCIGFTLYIVGCISDVSIVAQVGAYVLLVGILLIAMRIFFWLLEKIVERGLESMAKQSALPKSLIGAPGPTKVAAISQDDNEQCLNLKKLSL